MVVVVALGMTAWSVRHGGGFPLAFRVDDDLRWGPLALDLAFWVALGGAAVHFTPWRGRR